MQDGKLKKNSFFISKQKQKNSFLDLNQTTERFFFSFQDGKMEQNSFSFQNGKLKEFLFHFKTKKLRKNLIPTCLQPDARKTTF